jgi:hypothetical protein
MHRLVVAALSIVILAASCAGVQARTHDFDGDGRVISFGGVPSPGKTSSGVRRS